MNQCETCKKEVEELFEVELPRFKGEPIKIVKVCEDCELNHYHAMLHR
jgi:hypothetical protein